MTCRCHLCEPWNKLAEECDDEDRLNELNQQRLQGLHGLAFKPAPTRRFPPPLKLHDYSTPFFKAVLKDQEQERLREYLRRHMERARDGHERTAGEDADAAAGR